MSKIPFHMNFLLVSLVLLWRYLSSNGQHKTVTQMQACFCFRVIFVRKWSFLDSGMGSVLNIELVFFLHIISGLFILNLCTQKKYIKACFPFSALSCLHVLKCFLKKSSRFLCYSYIFGFGLDERCVNIGHNAKKGDDYPTIFYKL